jgi:hypothetical protein
VTALPTRGREGGNDGAGEDSERFKRAGSRLQANNEWGKRGASRLSACRVGTNEKGTTPPKGGARNSVGAGQETKAACSL